MEPKYGFDPDFTTPPWYRKPLPYVRWLVIFAVVAAAVALLPARETPSPQPFAPGVMPTPAGLSVTLQQPAPNPPTVVTTLQPRDRFVMIAPAHIDPQMVHPAPARIDEQMVIGVRKGRGLPPIAVVPPRKRRVHMPVSPPNSSTPKVAPKASPTPPAPAEQELVPPTGN
jgi:hypothetical protein